MKPGILLLFVVFALTSFAQGIPAKKHLIFFKNYKQYDFTKIAEGQKVRIVLKTGDTLYGPIQRIRRDTISIENTVVVLDNIEVIDVPHWGMKGPVPPVSGRAIHMESRDVLTEIKYTSDTSEWKPVFPSEKSYADAKEYKNLASDIKWDMKREDINTNHYPLKYNNFIKLNLARLIHLEFSVAYDRVITKKFTWESEFSVFYGPDKSAYYTINYPLYCFSGFSISTSPRIYQSTLWYLSPVFLYRYGWFNDVRTGWPNDKDSDTGQKQDEVRQDYVGSLRFGFMQRWNRFVTDFYFGMGGRYTVVDGKTYGFYTEHDSHDFVWYNPDHSPNVYNTFFWGLSINLGLKIGFGF